MSKKLPIALVIITWQEEKNLRYCLDSVKGWVEEMYVVDAHSSDRTVMIAEEYGAHVIQRDFQGYADQYNWALDNLPIRSEWILKLDGDEYMKPELWKEIEVALSSVSLQVSGFYMKRRFYFLGSWIRYGGYYPTWLLRLWKKGKGRSEERELDEHIVLTSGELGYLQYDFIHNDRRGVADWIRKHNAHSTKEANARAARTTDNLKQVTINSEGNVLGSQMERKRWVNEHVYQKFPLFIRPFFYFIYRYVFRLGFLDGVPGLVYHFLHGFWYRFLIDAKLYELRYRNRESNKL